jgi:hypothetical protein
VEREAREAQTRKRYMIVGGIIGAFILILAVVTVIEVIGDDNNGDEEDFPPVTASAADHGDIPSEPYSLGDPDAPVQLTEWSDYQ